MITLEEVLKWEEEIKKVVAEHGGKCGRLLKIIQAYKILSNKNKDLEIENKVLREMVERMK